MNYSTYRGQLFPSTQCINASCITASYTYLQSTYLVEILVLGLKFSLHLADMLSLTPSILPSPPFPQPLVLITPSV